MTALDPFTATRPPDIVDRFNKVKTACVAANIAHKVGALILAFTDQELDALSRLGFLTFMEMDVLRERGTIRYDHRLDRRP